MAPSKTLDTKTDTPSQADTPMTDVNDEVPSIPVDNVDAPMTVSEFGYSISLLAAPGMGGARVITGSCASYRGKEVASCCFVRY